VITDVRLNRDTDLSQIAGALDPVRVFARLAENRQQDGNQYRENPDDHQQLYKCKRVIPLPHVMTSAIWLHARESWPGDSSAEDASSSKPGAGTATTRASTK
jgi:hypothetical protein